MKDISQIEAKSRDEMVCPHCGESKLKPLPIAEEKNSKRDKILYGTTCANSTCSRQGDQVEPSGLAKQYSGGRFSGISRGKLTTIALFVLGALIIAQVFGFISFGGSTQDIQGTVIGPNGESVENAVVVVGNSTTTTNSTGAYSLSVEKGSYTMFVRPPAKNTSIGGSPEYNVSVDSEGAVSFDQDNVSTNIKLSTTYPLESSTVNSDASFTVSYANPVNAGATNITLDGSSVPEKEIKRSFGFSEQPTTFSVNGSTSDERLTLSTPIKTQSRESTYTYTGESSINLDGNLAPSDMVISFNSKKSENSQSTETFRVENEQSKTISIDGSSATKLSAILSGGSSESTKYNNGTWSGTDPTIQIPENDAPATVRASVTGSVQKTTSTVTGTLSDGRAEFVLDGNIDAKNVRIQFTGGNPQSTEIGTSTVISSGEEGKNTKTTDVARASSSGEYILDLSYEVQQNQQYVAGGYAVNGNREQVDRGTDTVSLNLDKGDTVSVWLTTETEVDAESQTFDDRSDSIRVTDFSFSPENPSEGQSVQIFATVKNEGSENNNILLAGFLDGTKRTEQSVTVAAGQTQQVEIQTQFTLSEGVYTISINEQEPKILTVGGATIEYGEGSIEGTLSKTAGDGKVNIDTDGDSEGECTVSASGGSCEIGTLQEGETTVSATEIGVSNTDFEVTYTESNGPENVKIDIDGDGQFEKQHTGILTESDGELYISETLERGEHTIDIEMDNNEEVEYQISWSQTGLIQQPGITVDGEPVELEETYEGETRVSLGQVQPGEHTVTLTSQAGSYSSRLEWSETPEKKYPPVTVNGNTVCTASEVTARNGDCEVPQSVLEEDKIELTLDPSYTGKDFSVTYTSREAPESVLVTGEVSKKIELAEGNIEDGEWRYESSVGSISQGETTISASSQGFEVSGNIEFTETVDKPSDIQITVKNEKFTNTRTISANSSLSDIKTISLPHTWFIEGENIVRVSSGNGVPVSVSVSTRSEINQSIIVDD
jgi:hypothetical protein